MPQLWEKNIISIQSLLWEWYIVNDTQNTVNCECGNEQMIWHRSFFLTMPKVSILLTERTNKKREKSKSLILIDKALQLENLAAGNIYEGNSKYSLAGTISHHGQLQLVGIMIAACSTTKMRL